MCSEDWNKGVEWTKPSVWLWDAPGNREIKQDCAGWCLFPLCSSTFEYRRNFLLEVYSWFFSETERMWEFWCDRAALGLLQWESEAGESIQRVYSNLSPMTADVQLLFYVMLNTGGAPLRFSSYLRGLWNENCSKFSFFLAANYEWEDCLISLDFLVFAYINWMISGSRLGLWHPVMILNWRMISGGKTRPLYSHSVFFSFKWIYKYAEKLSWGISYHPNFTSVEWCPISA